MKKEKEESASANEHIVFEKGHNDLPYCSNFRELLECGDNRTNRPDIIDIVIPMEEEHGFKLHLNLQDHFANQSYEDILENCRMTNKLFVDPVFTPTDQSLFVLPQSRRSLVQWVRASDFSADPRFIRDGATRFDINQGRLGDCWFLAAVGNLTLRPKLFNKVVPKNQTFEESYGIFRFNFYRFGQWIEVVVDDYLPTVQGQLIFMRSDSPNEFWSCLLEKAYAKVNGSYQALSGGLINEAMVDFSGGCPEHYDFTRKTSIPNDMFEIMEQAMKRRSMMGAGILPSSVTVENRLANGLVQGHAYSITGLERVQIRMGNVELVRVRNPWGNEIEWNGKWSDNSREWKKLTEEEKNRLNLHKESDGEFYMSDGDFIRNFDFLEVCHLSEDALDENDIAMGMLFWNKQEFKGSWVAGKNAGGSANNFHSFSKNPQFKMILSRSGDDRLSLRTVIVALMQKAMTRHETDPKKDLFPIGFVIYALNDEERNTALSENELRRTKIVGYTKYYHNMREISYRFKFSPGAYIVIPCTFEAGMSREFLLRIFSENMSELNALP